MYYTGRFNFYCIIIYGSIDLLTSRNVASWHPDSAHLVEWPPQWHPGLCAALPIETDGAKLLEGPIGTEPFRTNFVELTSGVQEGLRRRGASVPALEHLPPSAIWTSSFATVSTSVSTIWRKSWNFPSFKTHSLAWTRLLSITPSSSALGGYRPSPPTPDSPHLPTKLGGLGIRRYSGLAGETAWCLRTQAHRFLRVSGAVRI